MKLSRVVVDPAQILQACRAGFAFQPLLVPLPDDVTLVRAYIDGVTGQLVLDVTSGGFADVDPFGAALRPVSGLHPKPTDTIVNVATRNGVKVP